jgi:hypothetical protein
MLKAFRLDEIFRAQLGHLVEVSEWSACIDTLCPEVHMDNQEESLWDIVITTKMTLLE